MKSAESICSRGGSVGRLSEGTIHLKVTDMICETATQTYECVSGGYSQQGA